MNKPLQCPVCQKTIMDEKHGNWGVKSSTGIDETNTAEAVQKCPRCKEKYIIYVK